MELSKQVTPPEAERIEEWIKSVREEVEHQIFCSLSIPTNVTNRSLIRPVLLKYEQKLLAARDQRKAMTTPPEAERGVTDIVEAALDILHEAIQHTPLKLEETSGSDYHKGYIFYQDMVVRDVLDNTPKLKQLLTDGFHQELQKARKKQNTVLLACQMSLEAGNVTDVLTDIKNRIKVYQSELDHPTPLPAQEDSIK